MEKLNIEVKKNAREYLSLFENCNAETEEHKAFILENDQERVANVQWAKVAFEKYEDMMRDFKTYKEDTNALISKLTK